MKRFTDRKRGEVCAVDGLSFSTEAGEIFGLLGSNGAGKTTALRVLATVLKPTSGDATVAGYSVTQNPTAVRRHIGFLSGDMGFYHRLTPREVLSVFGSLNDVPATRLASRVKELIELFEIESFADSRMDALSTGMKQRASLARVLVHDPPVLILDEPTSGLDVPTAQIIENFILTAKRNGKCVVVSTHVMEEAEFLCDRIGVVHQGKLRALGTMDELRAITGKQRLREMFLHLLNLPPAYSPAS